MRKSNHGWWPHFIWTYNFEEFEEFWPDKPNPNLWFPPFIFKGYIHYSDITKQQLKKKR